jgi:type IV secretory pathway TrbD component
MTKRARVWVGATLLAVTLLNYAVIAVPLYRKTASLETRMKAMMIRQVRSGEVFKDTEDAYFLDILKKESVALDRKLVILNCSAASVVILLLSWIAYGLIATREDRRKI